MMDNRVDIQQGKQNPAYDLPFLIFSNDFATSTAT